MPDASVDAVVTDPPYSSGGAFRGDRMANTSTKYSGFSFATEGGSTKPQAEYPEFTGDNRDQRGYLYWCALWLGECQRILKPGGLVFMFTDWRQLPTTTDAIQAGGLVWRGVVVWDKGVGRPVKGRFRNHIEFVCWGTNGAMGEVNDVYPSSVIKVAPPTHTSRIHRTEKPLDLMIELLKLTKPGGVIFDPFMGSGSTGEAAIVLGHDFIGCEKDARIYATARQRVEKAAAAPKQLALFAEAIA
jgi:site-specific DNA-methyltransferase (adenine-specific)